LQSFWFFILSLKAWTPFLANLALAPLAILAGLLPLTLAGIGTRDAALIALYQPFFNAPTAHLLPCTNLFSTLRPLPLWVCFAHHAIYCQQFSVYLFLEDIYQQSAL